MHFDTTRWSLVLAARRGGSAARAALATLCEAYWYPTYAYVRRQGYDREDARDLTQAFFLSLLERGDFARVERERGRFRTFLLASARHFLLNDVARRRAAKRGGQVAFEPLDADTAERRYANEPGHDLTPERLFDRGWALSVLERALIATQQDFLRTGSAAEFDRFKPMLTGEDAAGGYRGLAQALGRSEGAVKVAVHRLRRRFQAHVRAAIRDTVSDDDTADAELAYLVRVLPHNGRHTPGNRG